MVSQRISSRCSVRLTPSVVYCNIPVLAVSLSVFQMYIAGINPLGLFYQRGIHLTGVMMLALTKGS